MEKIFKNKLLLGLVLSNFVSLTIVGLNTYLNTQKDGVLIFSEFVIIPLFMGFIAAWFWKDLNLKGKALTGYSVLNGLIAILLSYIFLREGFICLIIVSPLIIGFVITGAFIGRAILKKNNQKLNVSFVGLLLLVFVIDSTSEHNYENMVSDEVTVNARPDEIWKHVIAFDKIKEKNNYWLFKVGMPSPMQTTVSEKKLGANRKCIFSNGYIFDEKIVAFEVNKDLTFDIIGQPKDPEIMGHIDIKKGQFLLKDNGDGTTTLIGNSWYKLHVFPIWYYDLWAESITRNVHIRVMEHIKQLSEAK
ncbi:MAG: hypothetical protein EOO91_13985 [Pedobacter sp.]|nr:MAG: hypothetical protein EOO91_13985 [Pedobacter sp.]